MADASFSPLPRVETGIIGLDSVLDGGLVSGATCLVLGPPGSGKTTLGNQVAFHHAQGGGHVLFVTVLAESHERMLRRLSTFEFFDRALIGTHLHYLNLLDTLDEEGLDGLLAVVRREIRARAATLLVVDGIALVEELAASRVELRRFVSRLQVATGLAGCTTLLLGGYAYTELPPAATQSDGILVFDAHSVEGREQRTMRVVKFRGAEHLLGRHDFSLTGAGIEVYPRLEALAGRMRVSEETSDRLSLGVEGLDAMYGGGLLPGSSTLILGTPGSGKTIVGLHFLAAGVDRNERGMIATFHENAEELANTPSTSPALARALSDGQVEVFWTAPLEFSPDAWAWELLERVRRHRPTRLFIDGVSDLELNLSTIRMAPFLTAITNELRRCGVTTLGTIEIDAFVSNELSSPVPAISAMVDNGILLRHVEIRSRLRRLVSALKARQTETDPEIREFMIGPSGMEVGLPFQGMAALLTGRAIPDPDATDGQPESEAPPSRAQA